MSQPRLHFQVQRDNGNSDKTNVGMSKKIVLRQIIGYNGKYCLEKFCNITQRNNMCDSGQPRPSSDTEWASYTNFQSDMSSEETTQYDESSYHNNKNQNDSNKTNNDGFVERINQLPLSDR